MLKAVKIKRKIHVFAETERFMLREILSTDVDGMFELDADPEVHKYLGNKPVTNKEQIVTMIHFIRQQYLDNGIGRWAIIDKSTNEFMGWSGLKWVTELTNNHCNYYDLGYRIVQKHWRKGVATETAIASLGYAFEKLDTEIVYAAADCNNEGSNKILTKIGFIFVETFYYDTVKCNWYKFEKTNYK